MTSVGDDYEVLKSSEPQGLDDITATGKNWVVAFDMNNGSYSTNNIKFDLTQLSSSERLVNMREAVVDIPLVLVASAGVGNNFLRTNACDYMLGLKNAYHTLIQSVVTSVSGLQTETRVDQTPMYTTFKMLNKFSVGEAEIKGPSRGFAKDGSGWSYSANAGQGLRNNSTRVLTDTLLAQGDFGNAGLQQRMKQSRINLNAATATGTGRELVISQAHAGIDALDNYISYSADGSTVTYYIMATVHLQDISSFFGDAMPLSKMSPGSTLELFINQGYFTVNVDTEANARTMTVLTSNFAFGVNPLMITPVDVRAIANAAFDANSYYLNPYSWQAFTDNAFVITGSLAICKPHSIVGNPLIVGHTITNCRLRVPMYALEPSIELKYISENRAKVLEWQQLRYAVFPNIQPGQQLPSLVFSGINNAVGLLIVPVLSVNAAQIVSPIASPFCIEPAGCSPHKLLNFNVSYNGQLLFPENQNYSYAFYQQELSESLYVINGGHDITGVTSGLIRESDFKNQYGYYYVNLARRFADSKSSGSIMFYGKNNSLLAMDYHVFVICRQSALIDVSTGRLTMNAIAQ
jgi:hypothetical protein